MMSYSKIVIIGSPGAGKTTLAQRLSEILGIEVFHLDHYFWKPGWEKIPRPERIAFQQEYILGQEQWIIEGSYLSSSYARLEAADTIIFLDTHFFVCLKRVIQRHSQCKGYSRPDLPPGSTDRISLLTIAKILGFPYKSRLWLKKKLRNIKASQPEKNLEVLQSQKSIEIFLQQVTIYKQRERRQQHIDEGYSTAPVASGV